MTSNVATITRIRPGTHASPGGPDSAAVDTGELITAATRLGNLVGDVEWFAQPWRLDGPDQYSDLRDHVDAAGREARAAARILYMIGQNALASTQPPPT